MPVLATVGVFDFKLSGGASNSNPALSLGGVISSVSPYSNSLAWESSSKAGVSLLGGYSIPAGVGVLSIESEDYDNLVGWQDPSETAANYLVSEKSTGYNPMFLPSGSAQEIDNFLHVTLESGVVGVGSANIVVTDSGFQLFPDVTQQQAIDGLVRYRGLYVKQLAGAYSHILPVVLNNSNAGDEINLGWATEDLDADMELLASETATPAGVTFFSGDQEIENNKRLFLSPDSYRGLWVKQYIPPLTLLGAENSSVRLGLMGY